LSAAPMEEVVRAFNYVIEKGWVSLKSHVSWSCSRSLQAFYWATSEWSARDIEEAYRAFYLFLE
jgi:hypothetical protein